MYGRNEWCEFRDKMKAIALKYEPDLMDFGKYESLMKMKLDDIPLNSGSVLSVYITDRQSSTINRF